MRVCNPFNEPITVYKGTSLGVTSSVDTFEVVKNRETVNRIEVGKSGMPDHLLDLYKRSISELPENVHESVADLLRKNSDVFAKDDNDLGRTKIIKHDIDTGFESPIKQAPRRFPAHSKKK